MIRRMGAALCAALTVLCCIPAVAEAVEVSATACVLMDADSGRVLYEKNGRQRMLIASTTKLMTALVALEQGTLTDVVTVTASHMAEGSSMYLRAGEKLTLEELLYGLLLCSGNDAALAVTECAGGPEPFVALMNEKAAALGMALRGLFGGGAAAGYGAAGKGGGERTDAAANGIYPAGIHRRTDADQSQQAAGPHGGVPGVKDRVHEGGGADAGVLCGKGRTAAGGGDAAGRGRLERPRGTVPLGLYAHRRGK